MKVLHINYSDVGGGAEEFALSLSKAQPDSILLVNKKHTSNDFVQEIAKNKRHYILKFLDKVLWKLGVRISFRSFFGFQNDFHNTYRRLSKLEVYKQAEIIHLHNIHGEYFDLKALRQIAKEKHVVWTSHDMWINTGGEGGIPKNSKQNERRKLYPLKGGIIDERMGQLKLKKELLSTLKNLIVVAPSNDHHSNIVNAHPAVRIQVIKHGIDIDLFNTENASRNENTTPKILVFNSKSPYKNSTEIIKSIELIEQPFELCVIGNELYNDDISNIRNYGHISHRNELGSLFKIIDIACFSSNAETFGLLPAELAACGAKVFLNRSLPVFEEHATLYGATLFDNSLHLKNLIEESLSNINETREEGTRLAQLVIRNLNRNDTFKKYERLYSQLLNQWNNA